MKLFYSWVSKFDLLTSFSGANRAEVFALKISVCMWGTTLLYLGGGGGGGWGVGVDWDWEAEVEHGAMSLLLPNLYLSIQLNMLSQRPFVCDYEDLLHFIYIKVYFTW